MASTIVIHGCWLQIFSSYVDEESCSDVARNLRERIKELSQAHQHLL